MLNNFNKKINPVEYSPLTLAYIGDAVYELYIRTMLINKGNMPAYKLHRQAINYVKAKAQSNIMYNLKDLLTSEELTIYKRGRNAKSSTVPKNADINDYRHATGLETLIGFLYLKDQKERLFEILEKSIEICNK